VWVQNFKIYDDFKESDKKKLIKIEEVICNLWKPIPFLYLSG
jgi:hypothetical protein